MQQGAVMRQNMNLSLVKSPHLYGQYNYANPVGDKQKPNQVTMWHMALRRCAGTLAGQESLIL